MREFDEIDLEILELLMSDARRSWREIAEMVDLSAPAVSDRVKRLQETGVIRRFTIDVDRSQLQGGIPILVRLPVEPDRFESVYNALLNAEAVEYVFTTAEHDLLCYALVADSDVPAWLAEILDIESVGDYDVQLLTDVEWTPTLRETEFALTCAECGNTVTREGTAARIGDDLYQFCCPSCEDRFRDQYEQMAEEAEATG